MITITKKKTLIASCLIFSFSLTQSAAQDSKDDILSIIDGMNSEMVETIDQIQPQVRLVYNFLDNPSAVEKVPTFNDFFWVSLLLSEGRTGAGYTSKGNELSRGLENLFGFDFAVVYDCALFTKGEKERSVEITATSLRNLDGNHPILEPIWEDIGEDGVMALARNGRPDAITARFKSRELGATESDFNLMKTIGATCNNEYCEQIETGDFLMIEPQKNVDLFATNEIKKRLRQSINECIG